jgi:hypothetical protein
MSRDKDEDDELEYDEDLEVEDSADDEDVDEEIGGDGEFDDTDNVGDVSVEINVEALIAELEKEDGTDLARRKEIRRRLEELAEERSFEDTYAIDFGND